MNVFNTWLVDFLDAEQIDVSDKCTGGDGSELELGDVITAIVKASEWEKNKIRKQMFQCKAKGISIRKLLEAYAGHLSKANRGRVDFATNHNGFNV